MIGVKTEITKFVDYDPQPGIVECRFIDAWGSEHIFIEKVPIVTCEYLDENSLYPQDGFIACEIIEESEVAGRKIIKVTTEKPWYIESTSGILCFEVLAEQIEIQAFE